MKKALSLILCMLFCLAGISVMADEDLTIVHVTDMHYLSPALTDYGEVFMEIIENADGKVTHYTPAMAQAFVHEMLTLMPDAILLSGDLTLNGALQSHQELAEILLPLKQAGIQVLALPGNHAPNSAAYMFSDRQLTPAESMEDADFDDVYAALGYDGALSRDASSMSYVSELSAGVWCLLVDVNANSTASTVNDDTLAWIEQQLSTAQRKGITVIAVTHQPVLIHNSLFTFGYTVNNHSSLLALYEKYGVQLSLCGHLHMQHVAEESGMVEIAASSLAVSPNQYGVLRTRDRQLVDYSMKSLDVAHWAAQNGQEDANLLNFAAYSSAFFAQTTRSQVEEMFAAVRSMLRRRSRCVISQSL